MLGNSMSCSITRNPYRSICSIARNSERWEALHRSLHSMLWLAHGLLVNKSCHRRCRRATLEHNIKVNISYPRSFHLKNPTGSLLFSLFWFCINRKPFQAVLSSRKSDRESLSIGDCYFTQYENPQGNPSPRIYPLQKIAKRGLEDNFKHIQTGG